MLLKDKRARVVHEPLGVVAVIAPWNYPWTIPLGEVAFALMAGNGVVLKPASLTCLTGQRIAEVFERAGLPDGLLRVVHGGGAVGQALVESSVAKVFFTGSVEVGRGVGEACARRLKGAVLELGGKDPMLVLADADLRRTVAGALWGGFANAGQTCAGIERVYVAREVADRFVSELVAGARALRVGDPLRWDTEVGPMTSGEQFETVRELVDDAVAAGATLHCGGPVEIDGLSGPFYAPAVLTGVTHEMRIMREEIFGPVLPVMEVGSDEEAVALANDSRFGLGASVWTRTARAASASRRRWRPGWSGSTTTCTPTRRRRRPGAGSRTRASGAPTGTWGSRRSRTQAGRHRPPRRARPVVASLRRDAGTDVARGGAAALRAP